jgi:translation elongation factor P/translation initiation factor 5A
MDLKPTNVLDVKENQTGKGGKIFAFIREKLESIPDGQAVAMTALVTEVICNCPTVREKRQAYTRINHVLHNSNQKYIRYTNDVDGYVYIGKNPS